MIEKARKIIPGVSFSTDIIAGFPSETIDDHIMTLDVMRQVRYDGAYMFKYSPREGTKAYKMDDDVEEEIKLKRLNDIITLQQSISRELNQELVGREEVGLIEGKSKKSDKHVSGRTGTNKVVVFPAEDHFTIGDYVNVKIERVTSATLIGSVV